MDFSERCSIGVAIAAWLASSCGGVASGPSLVGKDASAEPGDAMAEAGWTQCASPAGVSVCGGPMSCPVGSATCASCGLLGNASSSGPVAPCDNEPTLQLGKDSICPDGAILVALEGTSALDCSPWDLGVLFANNGGIDRVRYVDGAPWTGAALPALKACPASPGVPLCGGYCGPCSQNGEICTGRSILHPYSFCVPSSATMGCVRGVAQCGGSAGTGQSCLTFDDGDAGQAVANSNGICVPTQLCQALAAGLPGGAICTN